MLCPYCKTENQPGATRCAACTSWMTSPPPIREWTRPHEGRVVAGVCRGISDRFGLPVAVLRFLFIITTLLGGWGLLIYLALWVSMPAAPQVPVLPAKGEQVVMPPTPEEAASERQQPHA